MGESRAYNTGSWVWLTLAMRLGWREKRGQGGFGQFLSLSIQVEKVEVPKGGQHKKLAGLGCAGQLRNLSS